MGLLQDDAASDSTSEDSGPAVDENRLVPPGGTRGDVLTRTDLAPFIFDWRTPADDTPNVERAEIRILELQDVTGDLSAGTPPTGWVDAASDAEAAIAVSPNEFSLFVLRFYPDSVWHQSVTSGVVEAYVAVRLPASLNPAQARMVVSSEGANDYWEAINHFQHLGNSDDGNWCYYLNISQLGSTVTEVQIQITTSTAHIGTTKFVGKGSIPDGGTKSQVLRKKTNTEYDTEWAEAPTGLGVLLRTNDDATRGLYITSEGATTSYYLRTRIRDAADPIRAERFTEATGDGQRVEIDYLPGTDDMEAISTAVNLVEGLNAELPFGVDGDASPEAAPFRRGFHYFAGSSTLVDTTDAYSFRTEPTLSPTPITADTAIGTTGTGPEITLLDDESIIGAVEADNVFITEWSGGMRVTLDTAGTLVVMLKTTHSFNGKSFTHVREHRIDVAAGTAENVPMSVFSRRSTVRLGSYTPPGGAEIQITATDLEGPTNISYVLEFRLEQSRGSDRITGNLTGVAFDSVDTTSYQLRRAVSTTGDTVKTTAIKYWRDANARGGPPASAEEETAHIDRGLTPVGFSRGAEGAVYMHFELPSEYRIDLISIDGINRFDQFTEVTATGVRTYHSNQLANKSAVDTLIRVREQV